MSSTIDENTYNLILNDLKYAKDFKAHSILFTSSHAAIGLGEMGAYFRIETNIIPRTFLKDFIIEDKTIRSLLKMEMEEFMQYDFFTFNPLITVGTPLIWIERKIHDTVKLCSEDLMVFDQDITSSATVKRLKKMKVEEGMLFDVATTPSCDYLVPMNRKLVPALTTDKVHLRVFDSGETCYLCFEVITKHHIYETYMKTMKV